MFCPNCGKQIDDRAVICPHCGVPTGEPLYRANPYGPQPPYSCGNPQESGIGWAFLGFFFPIVGLILYLVWKDQYPIRAKASGKGALISVCVYLGLLILYVFLALVLIAIFAGSAPYALLALF